jgi:type I restriction enzyme M protein
MLGAIIGDIAGSIYEFDNHKTEDIYDFPLFGPGAFFTDDTVMTAAVAKAVADCRSDRSALAAAAAASIRRLGRAWPGRGYGGRFQAWLEGDDPRPYRSFGNGAGMRVSPCGLAAATLEEAIELSRLVTAVTHDHPEGLKGAEAVAAGIFWARREPPAEELRELLSAYYPLDFTLDSIRPGYGFHESCQESVPQALTAFLEAGGFESAVRLAISIGGDSDTIAAMAGSLAEARWGVPEALRREALSYLDESLAAIVEEFEALWPPKIEPPKP